MKLPHFDILVHIFVSSFWTTTDPSLLVYRKMGYLELVAVAKESAPNSSQNETALCSRQTHDF